MEITIKGQCPCCKEHLTFMYESKDRTFKPYLQKDPFFDIIKHATLKQKYSSPFFNDITNIMGLCYPNKNSRAVQTIKDYFRSVEYKVMIVKDIKELEKVKIEISKKKVVVNKKFEKEWDKQKSRVLEIIKKKQANLTKKSNDQHTKGSLYS